MSPTSSSIASSVDWERTSHDMVNALRERDPAGSVASPGSLDFHRGHTIERVTETGSE